MAEKYYQSALTGPQLDAALQAVSSVIVIAQPESATAALGKTVRFSVLATGIDLRYQWQWWKESINDWSATTVPGNQTQTISVEATQERNGYRYRCVITDSLGNTVITDDVTLTVTAGTQLALTGCAFSVSAGSSLGLFAATGASDRLYGLLSCDAGYGSNALYLLDVSAPGVTAAHTSVCENALSPVLDWSSDYSDYLLTAPAHADLRCSFIPM